MEYTFTLSGKPVQYKVSTPVSPLDPQTKRKLRWSIAEKFDPSLLPLHACLVVKDNKGTLIAGASASGKSTLAEQYKIKGYQQVANDFVGIWEQGDTLIAGCLDLEEKNHTKSCVEVDKVIFLTPTDKRDIFRFTKAEATKFYTQAMAPWTAEITDKFTKPNVFNMLYDKHVCIGNRVNIERTSKLVDFVEATHNYSNISVIGVGTLGQDILNLALTLPSLNKLKFYSRNVQKMKCIELDLKSTGKELQIEACETPVESVKDTDILIMSFRVKPEEYENYSAQEKLNMQASILWDYSRMLRQYRFSGTVLMLSNPVDVLCEKLYQFSNMSSEDSYDWQGLFSNQIYGLGIGLDCARRKVYSDKEIEVIGRHSEKLELAYLDNNRLVEHKDNELLTKVFKYSESVRKYTDRTRFGPAHDTLNVLQKIQTSDMSDMRVSTLNSSGNWFGQPLDITNFLPLPLYDSVQN
jgi:malate/lactate dehydrogenase